MKRSTVPVLLAAAVSAAACAMRPAGLAADGETAAATLEADWSVVPPEGLEPAAVQRWQGEQRDHAGLDLTQILAQIDKPPYLTGAPNDAPKKADAEPPMIAQQHYLAARTAWRKGLRYEAISELHRARRKAPQHAPILRFLGRIYDEQANHDQSHRYFEQAAELEPGDPYTLFMLARHKLEQGRPEQAIAILGHLILTTPAQRVSRLGFWPLIHFYLGNGLARARYDRAATEQWRAYMGETIRYDRLSRRLREEAFMLHRARNLIWRRLGDAHHRLGEPLPALEAYENAIQPQRREMALARRVVFTLLRLRQPQRARQLVADLLAQNHEDNDALALVDYAALRAGGPAAMVAMLQPLYLQRDRPAALLLAMVQQLDPSERVKLLRRHMAAKPSDHVVFEHMVRQQLTEGNDPAAPAEAMRIAAEAISTFEPATDLYVSVLLRHSKDHSALLEAFVELGPEAQQGTVLQYLHAKLLAALGRFDEASATFERLVSAAPDYRPASRALVELLLYYGQYDRATEALENLHADQDPRATALRAQVLASAGKTDEATRLIDDALDRDPQHEHLVLAKATLLQRAGDTVACESLLIAQIEAQPATERAYEALIDLYIERRPAQRAMPFQRLWNLLKEHVPHSRVARRERARRLMAKQDPDFEAAHELLQKLLDEAPSDHRSLQLLLAAMMASDRDAQAGELLERRLAIDTPPPALAALSEDYYTLLAAKHLRNGEHQAAVDVVDRALDKPLPDPRMLLDLQQRALIDVNQAERIEPKLRRAIERFPDHEADLLFEWAMKLEGMKQHERAEQTMIEVLAKYPDHAPANNSLAYTWADRDKHLERAEDMIKRALATEPSNSAYLDSLGWVYYKTGRFQDAVEQLSRATMQPDGKNPIILDHLGDAMFRLDRTDEAVRHWHDALKAITPRMMNLDPEMQRLSPRVQSKLKAIKANRQVPVAASPGAAEAEEGLDAPPRESAKDGEVRAPSNVNSASVET